MLRSMDQRSKLKCSYSNNMHSLTKFFFFFSKKKNKYNTDVNSTGKLHQFIRMHGEPIYEFVLNGETKNIHTISTNDIVMMLEDPRHIQSDLGWLCIRKLLLNNGKSGFVIWDNATINCFRKITG